MADYNNVKKWYCSSQ